MATRLHWLLAVLIIIDIASCLHPLQSPIISTDCDLTVPQGSPGLFDHCPGPWCGPGDHPCTCREPDDCCAGGRYAAQVRSFGPGGEVNFTFLEEFGPGPDTPCCGSTCSASQCLELIRKELVSIDFPLEIQRKKNKFVSDKERRCGVDATDAQCLKDFDYTFVELIGVIQASLKNSSSTGC